MTFTRTIRNTLLAGSALLLSAGAAMAAPATAETDLNVRSGPGPEYAVVGTIPGGATVDVGGCTGSWCQVSFSGGEGFASRSYLAMGGAVVGPSVGVAVAPEYYDYGPDYALGDDYYDYGYYGPSVGFYAGGFRGGHRGWNGGWRGRSGWTGGNRVGTWQGRGGWSGNRAANIGGSTGTIGGRPSTSARVGMPTGGGFRSGGAAMGGGRVGGGAAMGGGHFGGGAPAGGGAPGGGGRHH